MTTNEDVPLLLGRNCEHTVAVMALARRIKVELRHEYEAIGILDPWRAAPLVLVELEAAESVRRCRLPRRSALILLAGDYSDDTGLRLRCSVRRTSRYGGRARRGWPNGWRKSTLKACQELPRKSLDSRH